MRRNTNAFLVTAAVATFGLGGPVSAAPNLVANPNFDDNNPPIQTAPVDWTFTPAAVGSDFRVNSAGPFGPFSAPNSANFGSTSTLDDELSQVLSTIPGRKYKISFELANGATEGGNDFAAQFGGNIVFSIADAPQFNYTLETVTATATSSSTTLAFFGGNPQSFYNLDNVSVTAVPEPATWAMLILGVAMIGFAARRRNAGFARAA